MFQLALNEHYPNYTRLSCVFQLAEPIAYTFHRGSKSYLLLLLQNRLLSTNDGFAHVIEIMVGEVNDSVVCGLLDTHVPIQDALFQMTDRRRIGIINDTVYPAKVMDDADTIHNRVPIIKRTGG